MLLSKVEYHTFRSDDVYSYKHACLKVLNYVNLTGNLRYYGLAIRIRQRPLKIEGNRGKLI